MKDDECLFTPGLHKSLRTHTCAGVHTEKRIHKCETRANIRLKMPLNVFPFWCKRQPIRETDGIISNHENCSWPQLMVANNPNECYTMFMIAILLSAYRLVENINCYANLSNRDKYRWAKAHVWGMSSLCILHISSSLIFFLSVSFCLSFSSFAFWKAVSLNPIQFLSAWGSFKALHRGQARRSSHPPPGCLREQKHSSALS